jgi:hypothetical protein
MKRTITTTLVAAKVTLVADSGDAVTVSVPLLKVMA